MKYEDTILHEISMMAEAKTSKEDIAEMLSKYFNLDKDMLLTDLNDEGSAAYYFFSKGSEMFTTVEEYKLKTLVNYNNLKRTLFNV